MLRTAHDGFHTTIIGWLAVRETLLISLDDLLAVIHKFIHPIVPFGLGPLSAPPRCF